jgi:cytochrome c biogenesis protein CcdA
VSGAALAAIQPATASAATGPRAIVLAKAFNAGERILFALMACLARSSLKTRVELTLLRAACMPHHMRKLRKGNDFNFYMKRDTKPA